jgi:hypothetical protein
MKWALDLLATLGILGAFDTLYCCEWRARLPALGKGAAAGRGIDPGRLSRGGDWFRREQAGYKRAGNLEERGNRERDAN